MHFVLVALRASDELLWPPTRSLLVVHELGKLDLLLLHLALPISLPQPVDRHDYGEEVPVQHRHPLNQGHANLLFQGRSRNSELCHFVEQSLLCVLQLVLLLITSTRYDPCLRTASWVLSFVCQTYLPHKLNATINHS